MESDKLHKIAENCMEREVIHNYYVVLAWKIIRKELLKAKVINEAEYIFINKLIAWHDDYVMENYKGDPKKMHFIESFNEGNEGLDRTFESLADYHGDDWKCYVIELICDYIAIGWENKNFLFEYYKKNKDMIDMPSEYREYLEFVLNIIREKCYEDVEHPMTLELETKIFNKD